MQSSCRREQTPDIDGQHDIGNTSIYFLPIHSWINIRLKKDMNALVTDK